MKPIVINTRPREQAAELTRLLTQAGYEAIEAPAIETLSAWDAEELETVRANLGAGAYAWVVLPSQNAGRQLADALRPSSARVVCGAGSARALGLQAAFALDVFGASTALEVLRPLVRTGQRILVPRAPRGTAAELIEALRALGADVHAPIAYRTVAVDPSTLAAPAARLRSGQLNAAVAVCSPSAIASLLAGMGRQSLSSSKLICLGATTAAVAREAALRVDGVAEKTTMPALVDAVRRALTSPAVPA